MLRTIRLTAAIVCFALITLLFLDFTGTLHTWFGWLAKIQFLPAVLALIPYCTYVIVRTYLLLGHLPVRSISRCGFVDFRQTEKESFSLFSGFKMASIWSADRVFHCLSCRIEHFCSPIGSL